jgi:NAD-dependent deacetylase
MKKIVFLKGAGISAESDISTFRDSDGLWENHNVQDVASIDGWHRNPELIIDFYNQRRKQLAAVKPNDAHKLIAKLEDKYNVVVITQNVDNLHEIGGSTNIIHLHGELTKACNENKTEVFDIGYNNMIYGARAQDGSLLRPFIVWFGEAVPLIGRASEEVFDADIVVIVGTSMQVYPAAGLINYAKPTADIYYIDPNPATNLKNINIIKEKATVGMKILTELF